MESLFVFLLSALQITLIDIVLSGDNVGVIALAIRNLPPDQAKKASLVGIGGAIGFRIFFASIMTKLMSIHWLPIKLAGGFLLLKITWDLMKSQEAESYHGPINPQKGFWTAVKSIVLADISMSLDNVLAIGGAAEGNIGLICFGILLNLPIIFFGAQFVANLMNKYKITIFAGAAILTHTAFSMILTDPILAHLFPHTVAAIFSWLAGLAVLFYGVYLFYGKGFLAGRFKRLTLRIKRRKMAIILKKSQSLFPHTPPPQHTVNSDRRQGR